MYKCNVSFCRHLNRIRLMKKWSLTLNCSSIFEISLRRSFRAETKTSTGVAG